jgi:hypothetical protein
MQKINITPEEQGKTAEESETPPGNYAPDTGRPIYNRIIPTGERPTNQTLEPVPTGPVPEEENEE